MELVALKWKSQPLENIGDDGLNDFEIPSMSNDKNKNI